MKKRRVTMADIAKEAGTHVTTVSLALRNSQRLADSTRERIHRLAKEMGYAPDPWMRALVSYRDSYKQRQNPPVIAYVTNWNTRWGWKEVTAHPEFYEGAEEKANELGFTLDHFWMREPGLTHGRLSQIFQSRGITGLIIASHVREIDDFLQFEWENFCAVKIDYFPHEPEIFTVTNNHLHIVRLAMRRVMDAGYRRIALVMDQGWDITVDNHWCAGYIWEQRELAPQDRLEPYLIPSTESLESWLCAHRPDAIISKAEFVFPVLEKMRWKVPDDVAFVDIFLEDETGRIAGVRQNYRTVGGLAVETLASLIQYNQRGVPAYPRTSLVEGTWIDGASLPRVRPADVATAERALR